MERSFSHLNDPPTEHRTRDGNLQSAHRLHTVREREEPEAAPKAAPKAPFIIEAVSDWTIQRIVREEGAPPIQ